MTQMQPKYVFLPSGSLQTLAFTFFNFRGKFYLGEGEDMGDLGFF